jgi:hypothetical protein
MNITDLTLLSDMNELDETRFLHHLEARREAAVKESTETPAERQSTMALGKIVELDDLINDIRTAYDKAEKVRAERSKAKTADMKKAF